MLHEQTENINKLHEAVRKGNEDIAEQLRAEINTYVRSVLETIEVRAPALKEEVKKPRSYKKTYEEAVRLYRDACDAVTIMREVKKSLRTMRKKGDS